MLSNIPIAGKLYPNCTDFNLVYEPSSTMYELGAVSPFCTPDDKAGTLVFVFDGVHALRTLSTLFP